MPSAFQQPAWIFNTNIYEVNLRQYTPEGTINAFIHHLPRLRNMGVETLWFMPLTPIAMQERKGTLGSYYACSDYTAINPEFGNSYDFKSLVIKAHELGFKIIIDWVANHTGWDHVWTHQHPEWYKKEADGNFKRSAGMEDIIELDFSKTNLRKGMIEAMHFWVKEYDIDGFRCDLANWVELSFWKEARTELEKSKQLFWFGEMDMVQNMEYMQVFDAAYTFTWMHQTEEYYKKNLPLNELLDVLHQYNAVANNNSIPVWFTSNHDENSWNGTEYEKYGDMAKLLAVFSCTWKGIPLIYSGQELPNNKRLRFFEKDEIEWTGKNDPIAPPAGRAGIGLHDFYKTLLGLHSYHNKWKQGDTGTNIIQLKTGVEEKVLAYLRKNGNKELLVILNFSREKMQFQIRDDRLNGKFRNVFTSEVSEFSMDSEFNLGAWEYRVFETC